MSATVSANVSANVFAPQSLLLTLAEAAARRGVTVGSVRIWLRKEKIHLASGITAPSSNGVLIPCLLAHEVDAVVTRSLTGKQREEQDALFAAGKKRCRKCNEPLPLDSFRDHPRGLYGKNSFCEGCLNAYWRQKVVEHRDYRTKYKVEYRQKHRDKVNAYRRSYLRSIVEERGERWQKMCEKRRNYERNNRAHLWERRKSERIARHGNMEAYRAWALLKQHARAAVQDGKTSPITKRTGFSLVRDTLTNKVRAARMDTRLPSSERVIGIFTPIFEGKDWKLARPFIALGRQDDCLFNILKADELRTIATANVWVGEDGIVRLSGRPGRPVEKGRKAEIREKRGRHR